MPFRNLEGKGKRKAKEVEKMGFVLLGFLSSCRELPFGGSGVQL
jgi:hypothetical protein